MKITIYTKEKIYNFKSSLDKNYKYVLKHAHREDGPAVIWYFKNGNIKYEKWQVNKKLHRINGPAIIWYYDNGSIKQSSYFLNNKQYSKDAFAQNLLKRKLKLV